MTLLDNKTIKIANKNLKSKIRQWQYIFFSLLMPIMFTFMFYFMFGTIETLSGKTAYDYAFPGMIIYATGIGTMNAAIMFAEEKNSGMLERLDTMPTGRKNIFLGALISESFFLTFQILVMFIIGYVVLGLYFASALALFFGFLIAVMFGISSVGLGIIIASFSKTIEIANAFSLIVFMLIIFMSGSLVPFDSPIVYYTPPFWAKQLFLQITVMGHGLNENLYGGSFIEGGSKITPIPLWGGLFIVVVYTIAFILIGILIFQKKTKF
jgi:ABC-2 type transport system permease protein